MSANITTRDTQRTTRPRTSGSRPVTTELTEIHVDGEHVDTVVWSGPLLQRLERKGWSRERYVAHVVAMIVRASGSDA